MIPCDGAYLGSKGTCPEFSFAVLGDTHSHIPANPEQPSDELLAIIEEVNALRPAFALSTGDLVRGYTTDEDRLRLEHAGARKALERLAMPFYPCIGNHDVREEISERVWREFWGGRYYSFDHGDCHFVVLDAEQAKDVESVAGEQLEWLKADLAEHAVGKRLFVTLHRPWWYDVPLHTATWKHPGGRNDWNDIVDPILRQYALQAVLCGHKHRFEVDHRNGVPHIVTGGAGGDIKDVPEIGGVTHYLWVAVWPEGFTWSVIVPGRIVSQERIAATKGDLTKAIPSLPLHLVGKGREPTP